MVKKTTSKQSIEKKRPKWKKPNPKEANTEKKAKESKRKPKYGMLSCLVYLYRIMWQSEKGLVCAAVLKVPLALAASALALYTPALILRYLENADRFTSVALIIAGLLLADMLSSLAGTIVSIKANYAETYISAQLNYMLRCRRLDRDFFLDYDPEIKKLDQRAADASNSTRPCGFLMEFSTMLAVVLKFFLFGSVLSTLSPWIVLLVIAGCFVNLPLSAWERKRSYETQDKRNGIMKKIDYLSLRLGKDFTYGKDIRLYSLKGYLSRLGQNLLKEYVSEKKKVERRITIVQTADFFVVLLRDGLVYAWLIYRAVSEGMDASLFVLYFTAVTELAEVIGGIRWWWSCV
ncbi:MAG: hypothetical protein NC548_58100, partial [Lachnospiraceae bacterium]|nr:hypothetical protein [Lachnospiraceae bacterium]